jgi:hypothetical protein
MIRFKTKKTISSLNDSEIIEQVKQHRFLYDSRSPDYRNLPMRNEIWEKISRKLQVEQRKLLELSSINNLTNSFILFRKCCSKTMESDTRKVLRCLQEVTFGRDRSCLAFLRFMPLSDTIC